jgi:FMN phosphatase YigB (HAD superfamily)
LIPTLAAAIAIPYPPFSTEMPVTLTLLLDLDDTLLGNQIDTFVSSYTRLLARHLSTCVEPKLLVQELMAATAYMLANQRPDQTLEENFSSIFYPKIGLPRSVAQPLIDDFYSRVFPALKQYTQTIPASAALVKGAFERGYRVAIATNPLFPRTAILQRLDWADAGPQDYHFAVIPDYEAFHFAKPNPAFYAELLARLDWPDGPVVMVGDSVENDVIAARQMGLASFWISKDGLQPAQGLLAPNAHGSQADVLAWLQTASLTTPDFNTPQASLAILLSTPAVLHSLRKEVPLDGWLKPPAPNEWRLAEIICHLRDVEAEVNLPRLRKIVAEDNPFLPGIDTEPWALQRSYNSQDCMQALDDFIAARKESAALLEKLEPAAWLRTAQHSILGSTTLLGIVGIIASHDRLHIQQVHQVMRLTSV